MKGDLMLIVVEKFGSYIIAVAVAVLFCGFGTVLTLEQDDAMELVGYAMFGAGVCIAVAALVLGLRAQIRMEAQDVDITDLAEDMIETRQRQRHMRKTQPGIMNVLDQENSVTVRQDARAKRVMDAHRHRSRGEYVSQRAAEIRAAREAGIEPPPPARKALSFPARFAMACLAATVPIGVYVYRLMVRDVSGEGVSRGLFSFFFG